MAPRTYLAPGQRYVDITADPWRVDQQLTILHIASAGDGLDVVTYRGFDGAHESTTATLFELAIANGFIVPVVATGRVNDC